MSEQKSSGSGAWILTLGVIALGGAGVGFYLYAKKHGGVLPAAQAAPGQLPPPPPVAPSAPSYAQPSYVPPPAAGPAPSAQPAFVPGVQPDAPAPAVYAPSAIVPPTVAGKTLTVVNAPSGLRIRSVGATTGAQLGLIPNGRVVNVVDNAAPAGWAHVSYNGVTGFSAVKDPSSGVPYLS
jgi:hypothetical protein